MEEKIPTMLRTCGTCGGIVLAAKPWEHKCDPRMVRYWETRGPHLKKQPPRKPEA